MQSCVLSVFKCAAELTDLSPAWADPASLFRLDWHLEAHRAVERVGNPQGKAITLQSIATKGVGTKVVGGMLQQEEEQLPPEDTDTSRLLAERKVNQDSGASSEDDE